MTERTDHELAAYQRGVQDAIAAASWVTDGNATPEHYARLLAMFDEGAAELSDCLPTEPNLSGEWADSPTPQSLAADILGADWETHGYNAPDFLPSAKVDALASAYEEGVSDTFQPECERLLRDAIS